MIDIRARTIAPAKLNLALHVRARRSDGYHDLETLFAFARDGDAVHVDQSDAGTIELTVGGPFAPSLADDAPADNLVMRAAQALAARCGSRGARLMLDKQLPVAAGLGGGSADAAAALHALNAFWDCGLDDDALAAIGRELGADVPACVHGAPAIGTARGDRLEPVADHPLAGLPLLIVNPRKPLSTAAVFARWDGVDRGPMPRGDTRTIWRDGRNDLEPIACALLPELPPLLDLLRRDALDGVARLSGSGASCFAIYPDLPSRDLAQRDIAAARPDYWMLASHVA